MLWNELRRSSKSPSTAHSCCSPSSPGPRLLISCLGMDSVHFDCWRSDFLQESDHQMKNVNIIKMKRSAHQLKLVLPPRFPYSLGSLMSPTGARGVCQKIILSIDDQVGRRRLLPTLYHRKIK